MGAQTISIMTQIENYQSLAEKDRKEVNIRNVKVMLYSLFNLANYEIENMISFWDGYDGFIRVEKIQNSLRWE